MSKEKYAGQITEKGIIDVIGNCANCGVEFHIHKDEKPKTMSKLREKLKTDVSINTSGEAERFAKQCEQITDDFAVKFFFFMNSKLAERIIDEVYDENHGDEYHTNKLLQIFKTKYYE